MENSFKKGFYRDKRTSDIVYSTGEVHPTNFIAIRGIQDNVTDLVLSEGDFPNFTPMSNSQLIEILDGFEDDGPYWIKKLLYEQGVEIHKLGFPFFGYPKKIKGGLEGPMFKMFRDD